MRLRGALVLLSAASLVLTGCTPQTDSLLVYSGRSEALIGPLVEQFEQQSGIEVEVRYAGSAELAAQLLEEGANSPADVFLAQDAGALGAAAKAGLLETMPDELYSLVPANYSAADKSWVGVSGRARVLVYDPSQVSDLPKSIFDLEDANWQGRIGIAPTNASFQAFVTAMRILHGDARTLQWLEAMKSGAVIYEKNGAILEAVEAGQLAAGLINHYYWYARAKEVGTSQMSSRLSQFEGADAGNLVNVAGVGILESSDEAERFVEFLLGSEGQSYFAEETREYPLVGGISPADELTPLADFPSPSIDLSDLDTLAETLELIRQAGLI
ncbi:MAG: iron ABC transporter substrate-binding protein [Aquiluna sp.]